MSHSPGCHSDKLGTCSLINIREYRMGNPEKLVTCGALDEEK